MNEFNDHGAGSNLGVSTILAALALALDKNGTLPKEGLRDAVLDLWDRVPEEAAVGDAGATIEAFLDLLGNDSDVVSLPAEAGQDNASLPPRQKTALRGVNGRREVALGGVELAI